MSKFNTCESALVRQYGEKVVEDIIEALVSAAYTVEQERSLWALAAVATTEGNIEFINEEAA